MYFQGKQYDQGEFYEHRSKKLPLFRTQMKFIPIYKKEAPLYEHKKLHRYITARHKLPQREACVLPFHFAPRVNRTLLPSSLFFSP